jgi:crotonobetainyl-CoA:carnitine CoA-transferase CaiB-like acyl-CoA transferase
MKHPRPLKGVVVVELGHSVAAPYAGLILADLGARVIKVENPGKGDYARGWGPPFWGDTASAYAALNRGKESITVDFSDPEQAAALRRLIIDEADGVIQNLRPGILDDFGLSAESFRTAKPSLIWCDIGAFGAKGPMARKPGYDPLVQASTGIMSVTGEGDRPPVRVGISLVDLGSGMWTALGFLSAFISRMKHGDGTQVSTSLYETGLAWMTLPLAGYEAAGDVRKPYGSGVAEIVPYQAFQTRDGWLMISRRQRQFVPQILRRARPQGACDRSGLRHQLATRHQPRKTDPDRGPSRGKIRHGRTRRAARCRWRPQLATARRRRRRASSANQGARRDGRLRRQPGAGLDPAGL